MARPMSLARSSILPRRLVLCECRRGSGPVDADPAPLSPRDPGAGARRHPQTWWRAGGLEAPGLASEKRCGLCRQEDEPAPRSVWLQLARAPSARRRGDAARQPKAASHHRPLARAARVNLCRRLN